MKLSLPFARCFPSPRVLLPAALLCGAASGVALGAAMEEQSDPHAMHDMGAMGATEMAPVEADATKEHGGATHGDHVPAHGGLVLMYGDLHFEVVAQRGGGLELHLSDAMRVELPALTVSDVTIEVERENSGFEPVPMTLSEAGDYWQGPSRPLSPDEKTTVHLAFVADNEALVFALPLKALQLEATETEGSMTHSMDSSAR